MKKDLTNHQQLQSTSIAFLHPTHIIVKPISAAQSQNTVTVLVILKNNFFCISQGKVATSDRWGGQIYQMFTSKFLGI